MLCSVSSFADIHSLQINYKEIELDIQPKENELDIQPSLSIQVEVLPLSCEVSSSVKVL